MRKKRSLKGLELKKSVISNLKATESSGGLRPSMIRVNGGIVLVYSCGDYCPAPDDPLLP
jgi:hypothetical protein